MAMFGWFIGLRKTRVGARRGGAHLSTMLGTSSCA